MESTHKLKKTLVLWFKYGKNRPYDHIVHSVITQNNYLQKQFTRLHCFIVISNDF